MEGILIQLRVLYTQQHMGLSNQLAIMLKRAKFGIDLDQYQRLYWMLFSFFAITNRGWFYAITYLILITKEFITFLAKHA